MKFATAIANMVPDFLKKSEPQPDYNAVVQGVSVPRPVTPFDNLEEHLALLVAQETEARAAHDAAVERLNAYMQNLRLIVDAHERSIKSLYERVPPSVKA